MKIIECTGSPGEMGHQYGEQARELIRKNHDMRSSGLNSAELDSYASKARSVIRRFAPEVLEELEGIAEGAGVDEKMVLRDNQVNMFGGLVNDNCTPVILHETDDGPIISKNNDSPQHEDYSFVIRKCYPKKGIPLVQITYAGWVNGLDAMNANGLANTHGSVGSRFDRSGDRIDIRLQAYVLMQSCRTAEEFIRELSSVLLTGKGFSIAVGDASGDTAILDAAVPFVSIRCRGKQFAYSTNLYEANGMQSADRRPLEKRHIYIYRQGYLRWIEETGPPVDLAGLKSLLSSHEPWAPCRHGGPHGSKTIWSMIALPRCGKMMVADGHPCEKEYETFEV